MLNVFSTAKPIIGMVNLKTMPGYPGFKDVSHVLESALTDAKALLAGGIDGILVENSFDFPHDPDIGPETVAAMAVIVHEIVKIADVPVGVVVIMEPGDASALAVAKAAGARFVRTVSFNEAIVSSFGIFEGRPRRVFRYRKLIDAEDIDLYADVHVKHSTPLALREIEESTLDAVVSGVDALIVTGAATGSAPPVEVAIRAKKVAGDTPVILGSGIKPQNAESLLGPTDGAIVGSYFKKDGVYTNPVDPDRVREMMKAAKAVRKA
jgi:hypothetical protein